jgi:hypothetical protein
MEDSYNPLKIAILNALASLPTHGAEGWAIPVRVLAKQVGAEFAVVRAACVDLFWRGDIIPDLKTEGTLEVDAVMSRWVESEPPPWETRLEGRVGMTNERRARWEREQSASVEPRP